MPSIAVVAPKLSLAGCPDYLKLMSSRAEQSGVPVAPPFFPQSFMELIARNDPAATPHMAQDKENPFRGKKILVICGKEDTLVPWNASEKFVNELDIGENQGGVKEVVVEPGVGHTCSPGMIKAAVAFMWKYALTTL